MMLKFSQGMWANAHIYDQMVAHMRECGHYCSRSQCRFKTKALHTQWVKVTDNNRKCGLAHRNMPCMKELIRFLPFWPPDMGSMFITDDSWIPFCGLALKRSPQRRESWAISASSQQAPIYDLLIQYGKPKLAPALATVAT